MNESRVKFFVIVIGIIVTFSLMEFLYIQPPIGVYIDGWVCSYAVIAILALLFGAVVGGFVGALGLFIFGIFNGFSQYRSPRVIPWTILSILLTYLLPCLYGFIIGKIFENKTIKADDKNTIGSIGLFSLLSVGLYIVIQILSRIINMLIYSRSVTIFGFIQTQLLSIFIHSLIIGCISLLLVLFCHKILKLCIPVFPNYKYSGNKEAEELAEKALQLMLKGQQREAVSLYEKAAKLGHMGAQYALGEYYSDVERNGKKAVYWYKRAAEQGEGYAQYNLGHLYQHGDIIGRNKTKAKYWFNQALKQRNEWALKYETKLMNNFTSINEANFDPVLIVLSIIVGIILGGIMASIFGFLGFIVGVVGGCIIVRILRLKL